MSALGPAQRGPFPVDGLEFGLFAGEKLDEIPGVITVLLGLQALEARAAMRPLRAASYSGALETSTWISAMR
jgi:hypothetical protein